VAPPAEPPGWQPLIWEYDAVTFIAAQVPSRALAAALDRGDAQVLPLGGYNLSWAVLVRKSVEAVDGVEGLA
jgi:hypothetical protein